jgi:LacI family transcriptional regulator
VSNTKARLSKPVTIYTVARANDVSIATISRILNGRFNGKHETRDRVLETIRKLNYKPRPEARRLTGKRDRTSNIGVLAPFFVHPFFVEVLKGCYQTIHGHDSNIVLYDVDTRLRKKEMFERVVSEDFLDGLLLVNMHLNRAEYERLSAKMPLVLIAAQADFADYVMVDQYKSICLGMEYLHELGHRCVAFINNENEIYEAATRERAFRDSAEALGFRYQIDYRGVDRRSGYLAARACLEHNAELTALFYYSDLMAYGGVDYVNERKLWDRVSIIGVDGFQMTFHIDMTTVVQPMERMGELGARTLLERMQSSQSAPVHVVLDPWLHKGRTCGKVSNG